MPFGEARTLGFNNQALSKLVVANSVINSKGMFFYSGTPALGNLIASIGVAVGGTDSFGNIYRAGDTSYHNVAGRPTTEVSGGQIALGTEAQLSGTGGQAASFIFPSVAVAGLSLQSALQSAADNVALLQLLSRLGGGLAQPIAKLNGVLDLQTVTGVPTQDTGNGSLHYTGTNGYPTTQGSVAGDTDEYAAGGRVTRDITSAPQTINTVAAAAVNNLSFPLAAGIVYELECLLFCTAGPNNVVAALAIDYTGTASACSGLVTAWDTNNASNVDSLGAGHITTINALTNYMNAINAGVAFVTHGHTFAVMVKAKIITTGAGTVSIGVNTAVPANTYTVDGGSYCTKMVSR